MKVVRFTIYDFHNFAISYRRWCTLAIPNPASSWRLLISSPNPDFPFSREILLTAFLLLLLQIRFLDFAEEILLEMYHPTPSYQATAAPAPLQPYSSAHPSSTFATPKDVATFGKEKAKDAAIMEAPGSYNRASSSYSLSGIRAMTTNRVADPNEIRQSLARKRVNTEEKRMSASSFVGDEDEDEDEDVDLIPLSSFSSSSNEAMALEEARRKRMSNEDTAGSYSKQVGRSNAAEGDVERRNIMAPPPSSSSSSAMYSSASFAPRTAGTGSPFMERKVGNPLGGSGVRASSPPSSAPPTRPPPSSNQSSSVYRPSPAPAANAANERKFERKDRKPNMKEADDKVMLDLVGGSSCVVPICGIAWPSSTTGRKV